MNLQEVANKIMGEIPRMSQPKAVDVIKEAWNEIVGERGWSWNMRLGTWTIPAQVSTGTVSVTNGSKAFDFDSDAVTALNATDAVVPIVGRQIRMDDDNVIYTIVTYDDTTGVGTLDRVYTGTTDAALDTWSVFRMYFTPPGGADFLRFKSVLDPETGYWLRWPFTKQELDLIDPQRQAQGNPYRIAFIDRADPTLPGVPRYELWPLPASSTVSIQVQYQSRGLTDYNEVAFPATTFEFPRELQPRLITEKCMEIAYKWAEAHQGQFDELRNVNWRFLWQKSQQDYVKMLVESKKLDNEHAITEYHNPVTGLGYPVDARFAQSHVVDYY